MTYTKISKMRTIIHQFVKLSRSPRRGLTTSGQSNGLRFDGRTAIITGAGRGLGREYALLLASRGANVVINDFNGDRSGMSDDKALNAAEEVAKEILNKWPESKLTTNCESVASPDGASKVVSTAVDKFGRVDILINNAGILRDRSFGKMSNEDWDQVQAVHLRGSYLMSKACWAHMSKQKYGKIIMTSSTSGLFGNFGQANYSAAKMGLIGLSNTLAVEGQRNNIVCNTVVPMAASRMTSDILPEDVAKKLDPAYVAPLVAWLCHEKCLETGGVFEAAGQWYGKYRLQRSHGKFLPGLRDNDNECVERIADSWDKISEFDANSTHAGTFHEHLQYLLKALENDSEK